MNSYIGHKNYLNGLKKRAEENSLTHAYLIVGEDGIGKSALAEEFSSIILRKEPLKKHVDSISYRLKKATIGIDEVRNIIEEINKKPFEGDRKVIIIHNGEKLTVQAQNALLKTIEEPPNGVFIILLAENINSVLETVRSRCQIYKLTPLKKEEMLVYANKIDGYEFEKIEAGVAYACGIPGKLDRFLQDEKLQDIRNTVLNLLREIGSRDLSVVIKYEKELLKYKDEKEEVISIIEHFIRDIILYKDIEEKSLIINSDKIKDIEELVEVMSYKKLNRMIKELEEIRKAITTNSNFNIALNILLMNFLEV